MKTIEHNAISCFECSAITDERFPSDYDECPRCESDNTVAVRVEPCPIGKQTSGYSGPDRCQSDDHHWGRGDHVLEEER
jgi:hypothetical protein